MTLTVAISGLLAAASANPVAMPAAILAGTFILEDAATIIVAALAAEGKVSVPLALLSLYVGIILGDLGLYALGRLALNHGWAKRFADRREVRPVGVWLDSRLMMTIFTTRFMPGLRLPTYTASGFFRTSFHRFALAVVAATAVWTSLLFAICFLFGAFTARILGSWLWVVVVCLALTLFLLGRKNVRRRFDAPNSR